MNPDRVVILAGGAMVAAAVLPVFRDPSGIVSGSMYKRIWAAGALTLFLAAMSDVLPQVTGPLALSLILVVIVKSGLFGKTTSAPINPPATKGK